MTTLHRFLAATASTLLIVLAIQFLVFAIAVVGLALYRAWQQFVELMNAAGGSL